MALGLVLAAGIAFAAACLVDLARRPSARYLPRSAWAVIICVSIPLGGIVYLAVGRRPTPPIDSASPTPGRTPPADDPGSAPLGTMRWRADAGGAEIEVIHLTKRFGAAVAIDDLSFTVRPGRVTGFLGPNGAGKTTTMRIILGLVAPTTGATSIAGRGYRQIAWPLRTVGNLLDADAAHPGRSARQHVLAIAQSNGIGRRCVDQVLEQVGLSSVADRRTQEFSLGMKQRLGMAVALVGDPAVLILDEPVNGLDPEGIRWIRQLLRALAEEGRTVFVSSHLMSEMAVTADHLVIIGQGHLLADTTTEAFVEANARKDVLVRSPRAAEVATLLTGAGADVSPEHDGTLRVTGMSAEHIAELAATRSLLLTELTPRHASLEDAYLDLTRDSIDYPSPVEHTAGRERR